MMILIEIALALLTFVALRVPAAYPIVTPPHRPDWLDAVTDFLHRHHLDASDRSEKPVAYEIGSGGSPVAKDVIDFDLFDREPPLRVVADARALPVASQTADVIFAQSFSWAIFSSIRQRWLGRLEQLVDKDNRPANAAYFQNMRSLGWNGGTPKDTREYARYLRVEHENIKEVMSEAERVLKPGGILFMLFRAYGGERENEFMVLFNEHVKAARRLRLTVLPVTPGDLPLPYARRSTAWLSSSPRLDVRLAWWGILALSSGLRPSSVEKCGGAD